VFHPYFSTKTTGMGLGLPIVHQIVTDHGGRIRVDDNPPRGTRFTIELPLVRGSAPPAPAPAVGVAAAGPPSGAG
jgi:signal transduction histidine kinase